MMAITTNSSINVKALCLCTIALSSSRSKQNLSTYLCYRYDDTVLWQGVSSIICILITLSPRACPKSLSPGAAHLTNCRGPGMLCPFPVLHHLIFPLCFVLPLSALRSLGEGGSFIEGVKRAGIQICRVGLAPPIVIPAKAGIQIPYFTGEVISAQIRIFALDIGPQFAYSAH